MNRSEHDPVRDGVVTQSGFQVAPFGVSPLDGECSRLEPPRKAEIAIITRLTRCAAAGTT